MRARFDLTDDMVAEVRDAAADGEKVLRWYAVDIATADGTVIARVRKQLYIRRKPAST